MLSRWACLRTLLPGTASGSLEHLSKSCLQAKLSFSAATAEAASSSHHPPEQAPSSSAPQPTSPPDNIYVACVVERLPVIAPAPPRWEAEYRAWEKGVDLQQGYLREYPDIQAMLRAQDEGEGPKQPPSGSQPQQFEPVPSVTKADLSGLKRTMRRKLDSRLYLVVKQQLQASRSQWQFPFAQHQGEEPIRATCERAFLNTFGRRYPVYFIGNAPMAHLPLIGNDGSGTGSLFFMLAQAVDDPWDKQELIRGCAAQDWVWVTRDELVQQFLSTDERLAGLAHQMLSD